MDRKLDVLHELDGCADLYLIVKHGLFYRPNANGYTKLESEAWKLPIDAARKHECLKGEDQITLRKLQRKPYYSS